MLHYACLKSALIYAYQSDEAAYFGTIRMRANEIDIPEPTPEGFIQIEREVDFVRLICDDWSVEKLGKSLDDSFGDAMLDRDVAYKVTIPVSYNLLSRRTVMSLNIFSFATLFGILPAAV